MRPLQQIIFAIFLTGSLTVGKVFAQDQWGEGGEIESVEIEIIKERQITLPRANRNFQKIPPRPAEPLQPEIAYDFKTLRFTVPEFSPAVKPLRLKQEELSKIYGGYVSAGFGSYNSPFLKASVSSKRNAEKFYGADIYHLSFGSGPVDGQNSANGNTRVNLFGTALGSRVTANIAASYENSFTHFYGYTPTVVEVKSETIRQNYNIGGISLGFENTKPSDFNFLLSGDVSYLADRFSAEESEVDLRFRSDYRLAENRSILFNTAYFLIARKDVLVEAKPRHLLKIAPSYRWTIAEKLRISAGLNSVVENDTIGSSSFHVYPDVWINYGAAKTVEAYAGLTGDFDKVSLHTLSRENQWVGPNIDIAHTNRALEFKVGVQGKLGRKFSFNGGTSFIRFKHLYFFENALTDRAKFNVTYDDAIRLNFFGEVGISHTDKIQFNVRGDYFSYATDKVDHPWHRPQYKIGLYSTYKVAEKVLLTFNFITQGGMKAHDNELNTVIDLKPALDLNLKLRYFLSRSFSIYVEGNNLLNYKYPVYLHYQARGIQINGGLSWSF